MDWKAIAGAALAAAALLAPSLALAQGAYHLRNDTRQAQNCRLNRPRSTAVDQFVLRAGAAWSQPAADSSPRRLVCDVGRIPLRAYLRPGPVHALVEDRRSGRIVVRIVPR